MVQKAAATVAKGERGDGAGKKRSALMSAHVLDVLATLGAMMVIMAVIGAYQNKGKKQ
jgi:hypothetical protein